MPPLTEGNHTGESRIRLANGDRSVETVTIASGHNVTASMVLGKITADGKYAPLDLGAADGTQAAAAISFGAYDATSADVEGVADVRDCEHNAAIVTWPAGITENQIATATAELAAQGIILR